MKKVFLILMLCCLFTIPLTFNLFAATQVEKEALLENIIISMQQDLQPVEQVTELDSITIITQELLINLLDVLKTKDAKHLQSVIENYVIEMNSIKTQQLDSECSIPLLQGVGLSVFGLVNSFSRAVSTECKIMYVTYYTADIISNIQNYKICVIDKSEVPDQTTRKQIVQRQSLIKTYKFITAGIDVFFCMPKDQINLMTYLNLFYQFINIFPKAQSLNDTAIVLQ